MQYHLFSDTPVNPDISKFSICSSVYLFRFIDPPIPRFLPLVDCGQWVMVQEFQARRFSIDLDISKAFAALLLTRQRKANYYASLDMPGRYRGIAEDGGVLLCDVLERPAYESLSWRSISDGKRVFARNSGSINFRQISAKWQDSRRQRTYMAGVGEK